MTTPAQAIECPPSAAAAPAHGAAPHRPVHHMRKPVGAAVHPVHNTARKHRPSVHRVAHGGKPFHAAPRLLAAHAGGPSAGSGAPRAMLLLPGYSHAVLPRDEACDKHPPLAMSLLPGAPPPEAARGARGILEDLAGPPAAVDQGVDTVTTVPPVTPETVTPVTDDSVFPGLPGFQPGVPPEGVIGLPPGTPGFPGVPGVPVTPAVPGVPVMPGLPGVPGVPVAPGVPGVPVVPVTPGVPVIPGVPTPPDTDQPPPVVVVPPVGPPGPGPTGAVPEPATWAMLILGFFGTGAAVRNARRRRFEPS